MKVSAESVAQSLEAEYDFEDFDLLFDQVKERVGKMLMDKTNDITEREKQRQENEAMKKEIFEVRVNRLKEVGFVYDEDFGFTFNKFTEFKTELDSKFTKDKVLNATSSEFESLLTEIKNTLEEAEKAKRDAEIKKQKDEQFNVRKNRLFEIGFGITDNLHFMFCKEFKDISIPTEKIFQASITEFEEIMVKAKQDAADAKEQKEIADAENLYQERVKILLKLGLTYDSTKEYHVFLEGSSKLKANREILVGRNQEWFDEFVSDVEKEIKERELQAKNKADAENKARVKL
jgi:hypothetical protein